MTCIPYSYDIYGLINYKSASPIIKTLATFIKNVGIKSDAVMFNTSTDRFYVLCEGT